jgi:hypothetical protein
LGQAVRTQLVDRLLADLLQDVRFLREQLYLSVLTGNPTSSLQKEIPNAIFLFSV